MWNWPYEELEMFRIAVSHFKKTYLSLSYLATAVWLVLTWIWIELFRSQIAQTDTLSYFCIKMGVDSVRG